MDQLRTFCESSTYDGYYGFFDEAASSYWQDLLGIPIGAPHCYYSCIAFSTLITLAEQTCDEDMKLYLSNLVRLNKRQLVLV